MAKKISKVLASERDYKVRPFALVDHEHEFYPNTVADIAARDAIVAPLRYEGVIVYVKSDQTTYQLRGGSANANWITLVDNDGATSHTTLADIGSYTHVQIDSHIDDATLHFTEASITITESQISDLGAYALASHDHDAAYLGITDTAVAADALTTTGASVDVSAAAPPVAGQILTAVSATAATWQNAAAAGIGDIVQTGSPIATHIGYFTADKNLSGDAGLTWVTASALLSVIATASPEIRIQDSGNPGTTMTASLSFWDSTGIAAEIRMDGTGDLRIENADGEIRFDTGTSDVVVSGNGDLSVGNDLDITGYITGYGGTPADGSTLQWVTANGRAEFTLGAVMATGTPVDNQVAIWTAANEIEGDALFTWDGADLIVGAMFWDGSAAQLLLGDGTLGAPGLEIDGSATATPYVNLSQAGTVRAMFRFSDGSDRVEISSTADDITLRPGNVDTVTITQAALTAGNFVLNIDQTVGVAEDGMMMVYDDATGEIGLTDTVHNLVAGEPGTEGSGITINGSSYDSHLKVSDIGDSHPAQMILHRHSTTLPNIIVGARTKDATSSHTIVADNDHLLNIIAAGWDGVDYAISSEIQMRVDGVPGIDDMPGEIAFLTSPDGSHTAAERGRFFSGGLEVTGDITLTGTVDGVDVAALDTAYTAHAADATIHFTEASIDIPLTQGANDVTATFGELNLLDLAGLTAGWVLSADTATTASWKAPAAGGGGSIGGSITDNQIAVGATTANDIEGSASLTWDGTTLDVAGEVTIGTNNIILKTTADEGLDVQSNASYQTGVNLKTNDGVLRGMVYADDADVIGFIHQNGSSFAWDAVYTSWTRLFFNGADKLETTNTGVEVSGNTVTTHSADPSFIAIDTTGSVNSRLAALNSTGVVGTTSAHDFTVEVNSVVALTFDQATSHATFTEKVIFDASTTADPSFNIPEGVAPTAPVDGDHWLTAAGEYFVRLNGVSVDLAAGGGGIGGSITDNQVAVGATTADDIEGDTGLTYTKGTQPILRLSGTNGPQFDMSGGQPQFRMEESDQTLDQKNWMLLPSAGALYNQIYDDAYANAYTWMQVERSGTGASVQVDTIDFTAVTDVTINSALVVTGAFTSRGIDDNATLEVFELANSSLKLGQATGSFVVSSPADVGELWLSGGNDSVSGAVIRMMGGAHASAAGDMEMRADSGIWQKWDESVGSWTLSTSNGAKTLALTIDSSQRIQAPGSMTVGQAANGVAVLEVRDNATAKTRLFGILADDGSPWHMCIQNSLYSTNISLGMRFQVDSTGSSSIYAADDGVTPADLVLRTDAAAALTLDGSTQNATFAGDVHVDGARLSVGSTAPLDTHLSTLETIEVGIQTVLYGANNTGGSHFMRGAYHNGTNWVKTVTGEEVSALSFLGIGNIKLRTATSGTAGDTVSWIDSFEVDNATGDLTMTGALLTSASTTTRAGFNIAEGVAPTTPVDGDLWITAAGAFNARLNGVTVDVSAGGGGSPWTYTLQTGTTYTAVAGDFVVASNTGTVTITLPSGHSVNDTIIVKKTGASGTVTVDGNASETIDGALTFVLNTQYDSVTLISDGTNWLIV